MLLAVPMSRVSAHELRVNNGISAFLHIPPEDSPVAKESTKLELEFSNGKGDFLLNDYAVTVKAMAKDNQIASAVVQPAFFGSASQAVAYITFPKIDTYTLTVTGIAKSHNVPNFSVQYPVNVATVNDSQSSSKKRGIFIVLTLATALIILGMAIIVRMKSRKRSSD